MFHRGRYRLLLGCLCRGCFSPGFFGCVSRGFFCCFSVSPLAFRFLCHAVLTTPRLPLFQIRLWPPRTLAVPHDTYYLHLRGWFQPAKRQKALPKYICTCSWQPAIPHEQLSERIWLSGSTFVIRLVYLFACGDRLLPRLWCFVQF